MWLGKAASTGAEQIHANHAVTGGYVSDYPAELFERVLLHFGHDETMAVATYGQKLRAYFVKNSYQNPFHCGHFPRVNWMSCRHSVLYHPT